MRQSGAISIRSDVHGPSVHHTSALIHIVGKRLARPCILWLGWPLALNIVLMKPANQFFVSLRRAKNHTVAHSRQGTTMPGLTPLFHHVFSRKDRASLQSDPVAAATVPIKRQRRDSVKRWFVTQLLTLYLVSTGCGKEGQRPSICKTYTSGKPVHRHDQTDR